MYTDIGELSIEWQQLLKEIEEQEGVLTGEQVKRFSELEGELAKTVEKLAGVVGYYKVQANACEAEIDRLKTRQSVYNNKAGGLERFIQSLLQKISNKQTKTGSLQFTTPLVTVSESSSQSVKITKESDIPEQYKKYTVFIEKIDKEALDRINRIHASTNITSDVEVTVDKAEITRDLKANKEVPGAEFEVKKTIKIK